MAGHDLENVSQEKDLGVIIDEDLKFHKHTAAVVKKANNILSLINKSFESLDRDTLPKLFTTLVRPHLEYGNAVWGPFYKLDQKAVD